MNIRNVLKRIIRWISSESMQKRLGYSQKTKLLIIHADDLGLSGSENRASIAAMEKGMVNSGSIMVPCAGFQEIVEYSKNHPEVDLGIHLTLTSEWASYKWGPLLASKEVTSLVDKNGFFLENTGYLKNNFIPFEVEKELRAQINRAKESGIDLTHIDSHMFAAFSDKEILQTYIKLGKEFKLPVLLTGELPVRYLIAKNAVIVDHLYCAQHEDNTEGLNNYYRKVLGSLKPGLNCILLHVAFDNREMQDVTGDHLDFGSAWRQADYDFFTGDECRQLINDNNIQLITWREIRDKLVL